MKSYIHYSVNVVNNSYGIKYIYAITFMEFIITNNILIFIEVNCIYNVIKCKLFKTIAKELEAVFHVEKCRIEGELIRDWIYM